MKRLLIVVALLAAALAFLSFTNSDHYLFIPDRARPVDPLIKVAGEKPDPKDANGDGVYMVDILIRKASLLERYFPSIVSGATLVSGHALNPGGASEEQRAQQSKNQMSRSQEIAAAVALKSLGYDIEITGLGARVDAVSPGRPADGVLQPGDAVVEANGEPVKSGNGLVKAMKDVKPGDEVELVVIRDDKRMAVTVETVASPDDPKRAIMGIAGLGRGHVRPSGGHQDRRGRHRRGRRGCRSRSTSWTSWAKTWTTAGAWSRPASLRLTAPSARSAG